MTAPRDLVVEVGPPAEPPPPRRRPRREVMIGAVVVIALIVIAFFSFRSISGEEPRARPSASPRPSAPPELKPAEIYAALAPSVVTIETLAKGTDRVTGSGTGVIANGEGVILTALHVVSGGGDIRVRFADGTPAAARILASDPEIDIAALAPSDLPNVVVPATLGNSGRLAVGDSVVAIGNQLGLTSSATSGVVSGLNRATRGSDGTSLSGLIQFDAAVNPGSSGGPLVNTRGETIGIVVALANPTEAGTFIGIGFAVPIGAALGAAGDGQGPQQ